MLGMRGQDRESLLGQREIAAQKLAFGAMELQRE